MNIITIIAAGIAPPVKATIWIRERKFGLRVENDYIVQVGNLIEAGILGEDVTNLSSLLIATVEDNMELAS